MILIYTVYDLYCFLYTLTLVGYDFVVVILYIANPLLPNSFLWYSTCSPPMQNSTPVPTPTVQFFDKISSLKNVRNYIYLNVELTHANTIILLE